MRRRTVLDVTVMKVMMMIWIKTLSHQQQTDFLPPLLLKETEWLSAILYSP